MDYYQILKLSPNANHKEIEEAYNRLVKESRYNAHINRKDVDAAYRILSDPQQKELYDSHQARKSKRIERAAVGKYIRKKIQLHHLLIVLAVLSVVAVVFFGFRYGYRLKSFSPGDVLYYTDNNQRLGRIIRIEDDYNFGSTRGTAYLVEMNGQNVWLPEKDIKSRCFAD